MYFPKSENREAQLEAVARFLYDLEIPYEAGDVATTRPLFLPVELSPRVWVNTLSVPGPGTATFLFGKGIDSGVT